MAAPKKVVVKLNIHGDKDKAKAMKAVSCIEGITSIGVDMKESQMTIVGDVDPVQVIAKLKKQCCAQIVTVGPFKDEKQIKEEEAKKKKEEEEKKKKEKEAEEKKQKEKEEEEKKNLSELLKKYGPKRCPPLCPPPSSCPPPSYCPPCPPPSSCPPYYYVQGMEENPNSCVIC